MPDLLRTPLYDWHVAHGGRMVEFGGWDMPVQYQGIVEEHHTVRRGVGLFDISHMGRFTIRGAGAIAALEHVVTSSVATLKPQQVRYGLVCREDGGILDDVLVYHGSSEMGLVVNASNRQKIWDWLQTQFQGFDCALTDDTPTTAMIALQGPRSIAVVQALTGISEAGKAALLALGYYRHTTTVITFRGHTLPLQISRTGYTGEDGYEFVCPQEVAADLWEFLMEAGAPASIRSCGLGARDTLRLEAAMPLYGHELSESIDPFTAGLDFAVKLQKPEFVGQLALQNIAQQTDRPVRVGLELAGRRIAREGAAVFSGETRIGEVTSGTFSPTLERAIAMAYVSRNCASTGTAVEIDIRGKREAAKVVPLPFYRRSK